MALGRGLIESDDRRGSPVVVLRMRSGSMRWAPTRP